VDQRFAGLGLNERQLAGLRYLQEKGRITMQEYAKATDSSERTAKRDLKEMVEKKVLVKHGKTKGSWYGLPEE
jgi:DeoR/GlpR family transcriptional regulator of sugar metabolism